VEYLVVTFLPNAEVLVTFSFVSVVLILTPGADMALFLGQSMTAGRLRGFAAMLGVTTGVLIHSLLAAFGLSALLAASTPAFTALKISGVLYLGWLAIGAIRHGSALAIAGPTPARPLAQVYLMGLGVNLLNPKIVLFFVTFLPQFVSSADPQAHVKLFFLGCYFMTLALPICSALILAADRFSSAVRGSPRVRRAFDWLFAGLMGTFALRLLFSRAD
jgi:threonine/homoserine/homoserine lactone efflux protein